MDPIPLNYLALSTIALRSNGTGRLCAMLLQLIDVSSLNNCLVQRHILPYSVTRPQNTPYHTYTLSIAGLTMLHHHFYSPQSFAYSYKCQPRDTLIGRPGRYGIIVTPPDIRTTACNTSNRETRVKCSRMFSSELLVVPALRKIHESPTESPELL